VLYTYLGQFDKSLAYYQRKLSEAKEATDPFVRMGLLRNLGISFEKLGHYGEALVNFHKAYDLAQQTGDRLTEGTLLWYMGSALWGMGSLPQSLSHFTQSLPLLEAAGYKRAQVAVTINMGTVYGDLGEHDRALQCFDSAMVATQEQRLGDLEIEILWRKGSVLLKLGRRQEALAFSRRAIALIEQGESLQNLVRAYLNHVKTLEANDDITASRRFLKRAYDELMRRAARIEREDLRAMFLQNIRDHREIVSRWQAARQKRNR